MTQKRHTGFTDADVDGVKLGVNAGNFQKDDSAKVMDDANAQFSDLQDVNIPTVVTQADNGKVIGAVYVPPAVYGDEADGNVTISTPTQINVYTDLTADALSGASVVVVQDASSFAIGMEVMFHKTQVYRDQGNEFKYYFHTIQNIVGNTVTLTTALADSLYSDSDGDKQNNTKTQMVSVPNYTTLTLNSQIIPKDWDGYSGGIIVFRAKTLTGAGSVDASGSGYRSYRMGDKYSGQWGNSENHLSKYEQKVVSAQQIGYAVVMTNGGQDRYAGGGSGADGTDGTGVPTEVFAGLAYTYSDAELQTRIPFGGSGVNHYQNVNLSGFSLDSFDRTGGAVVAFVETHTGFTGDFTSNADTARSVSSGGVIAVVSGTAFSGTTSMLGSSYGAVGRFWSGASTAPTLKEYQLGNKVVSSYTGAAATDLLDKTAVDEAIATGSSPRITAITAGIDLTTVAQTSMYTVPTGKVLLITAFDLMISAITGDSTMPTVQLGKTGSTASILAPVALSANMKTVYAREKWDDSYFLSSVLVAGEVFEFGVTIAGASTTQVAKAILTGILVDA